jgi:hypothetical protein
MIARRAAVLAVMGCLATLPAAAAELKFNLLSIKGLVVGTTVKIDAAFGEKHGVKVASPFQVLVPKTENVQALMDPAPKPGDSFVKFNFATPDRKLIENIQFVPMKLPLGPEEQRLKLLAKLLTERVFPKAVAKSVDSKRLSVRKVDINGIASVEVVGLWQSAAEGKMYIRIVGIPHPRRPESVFTVANVVAARQDVPSANDLPRTRGGTALRHFKYLD